MLRITAGTIDRSRTCLVLEGRLIGEWVPLLATEIERLRAAGREVTLDLTQVDFAAPEGLSVIARQLGQGVVISAVSPALAAHFTPEQLS